MARTAILSHIVIDEIREPGSASPVPSVGGAGAYAAVGASLVSGAGEACLVSGVGSDDRALLEDWCTRRGIDPSGLFTVGARSPRTRIDYFRDGERHESPVYGLEHFDAHTPRPEHLPADASEFAGIYLFHAHEDDYWDAIHAFRRRFAAPILWEISALSCEPELIDVVRERARSVSALSLNIAEGRRLTGLSAAERIVREIGTWCPLVLLRMGAEGSLLREGRTTRHLGAAPVRVIDPTGGGNGYSGAFLAALAGGSSAVEAAARAAAAAACVIRQTGAPEVDDELRAMVADSTASIAITSC